MGVSCRISDGKFVNEDVGQDVMVTVRQRHRRLDERRVARRRLPVHDEVFNITEDMAFCRTCGMLNLVATMNELREAALWRSTISKRWTAPSPLFTVSGAL